MTLGGPNIYPRTGAWLGHSRKIYPQMTLNCPCGQPATWILLYACQQNNHTWEEHLCQNCHTQKTRNQNITPNTICHPTNPWTCLNIQYQHPNGTTQKINCNITHSYTQKLTPTMIQNILNEKVKKK